LKERYQNNGQHYDSRRRRVKRELGLADFRAAERTFQLLTQMAGRAGRGEYRSQVLVKGTHRRKIREALQAAIAGRHELQRRVIVDIDPLSVL